MKIGKDRKIKGHEKKNNKKKPNDFFVIDYTSNVIIMLAGSFVGAILGWRIWGENGGCLGATIGIACGFFGGNFIISKFVEPDLIKFIENSNKTVVTALNLIFIFLYAFVGIEGVMILSRCISGKMGKVFNGVFLFSLMIFIDLAVSIFYNPKNK